MNNKKSDLKYLEGVYDRKGIVLVLGAGVSIDSGLPTWTQLLKSISDDFSDPQKETLYNELRQQGYSLQAIASSLESHYKDKREFAVKVQSALYKGFPFFDSGKTAYLKDGFLNFINDGNTTLRSIAAICIENKLGAYTSNERIKAVVTFNLDTLLEAFIETKYKKPFLRAIDQAAISSSPTKISVYHMHGYLPFYKRLMPQSAEPLPPLVLTEQEYFDFFNNPTSLFNYTFLYFLHEHSCLFIGLSLLDDNVRRLLHYSKQERTRSLYDLVAKVDSKIVPLRHFAILKRPLTDMGEFLVEQLLYNLGIRPLWIDDYSEIQGILCSLYEKSTGKWDSVYYSHR